MADKNHQSLPTEARIQLAIEAFQRGEFKSLTQSVAYYDVLRTTVRRRLRGIPARADAQMNNQRLLPSEEKALEQWILSMDERGMAPTLSYTRSMANLLLGQRSPGEMVGKNWVQNYVTRHLYLKSRYSRRYDYQRARCEDPVKIQAWFNLVARVREKYGIPDEDVYNFDETGFQMGVARTAKVITRSDRRGRPMVAQPGNREWVTIIEAVNCTGWALPAKVIFPGKVHQKSWYISGVPGDWAIRVSPKG